MSNQVLDIVPGSNPAQRRGRGSGVMSLAFFGSWWLAAGLSVIHGPTWAVLSFVLIAGSGLFVTGWRQTRREAADNAAIERQDPAGSAHRARVFRNINIAQWVSCAVLVVVLNIIKHVEWIMPGIMLIVALHFLPLAKLFQSRLHVATGAALAVLAASYPFFAAAGPTSGVGPVGAGLILWASAAAMLYGTAGR
jgi:hypothetical protein